MGLCGAVQQQQAGPRRDGAAQLVGVEGVRRWAKGHRSPHTAGEPDAGHVGVVVRLEHDDLVAGVDQREQGGGDGLGGAGGDEDLAVGVVRQPVEAPPVLDDGATQLRDPRRLAGTGCDRRGSPGCGRLGTSDGPSVSGKPCPRLIEPVARASADISAKTVVPSPCTRAACRSMHGRLRGGGRAQRPGRPTALVPVHRDGRRPPLCPTRPVRGVGRPARGLPRPSRAQGLVAQPAARRCRRGRPARRRSSSGRPRARSHRPRARRRRRGLRGAVPARARAAGRGPRGDPAGPTSARGSGRVRHRPHEPGSGSGRTRRRPRSTVSTTDSVPSARGGR